MNESNKKSLIAIFVTLVFICSTFASVVIAKGQKFKGFDKGVSYKEVLPLKKVTFVNFDKDSLLDDYAYLAAVPTAVFESNNVLFSHPLLFYEDPYPVKEDKERSLNARQGIDYFMEDWMSYCNGQLDQMTIINVPKENVKQWHSKYTKVINGEDPYTIASELALTEWSYSDNAVIAVINDSFERGLKTTKNSLKGTFTFKDIVRDSFEIPQTNHIDPQYREFTVPEGYKFLKVRSWYPSFYFGITPPIPGFQNIVNMSIPSGDRDLQLYCNYNGDWMEAKMTISWNAQDGMDADKTETYVYQNGKWRLGLTDTPTKSPASYLYSLRSANDQPSAEPQVHRSLLGIINFGRYGRLIDVLKNLKKTKYKVDIDMYPGIDIKIPDRPSYGVRNATFVLTWNNPSIKLGLSLIGPYGEEIVWARNESNEGRQEIKVERLGECLEGEYYTLSVYALDAGYGSVDFNIEYSWEEKFSREEGDCLASATEGAILASIINAPLLYVSLEELPKPTVDAIYKLGVKNVYLINLGNHASSKLVEELNRIVKVRDIKEYEEIYREITDFTKRNDIVFSTIDPWTYWYLEEMISPAGETNGALHIGPAAYIAAHHGVPVFLVDNHPELSKAAVYHTEFWRRYPDGMTEFPTVACMYLTGREVYKYLDKLGFDKEGQETLITVAGQFDIGLPWDRVFTGKAKPGRFFGSPTDVSVWISRTIFYPALIFENPALKGPVKLINGSESKRRFPWWSALGLKITKPSQEEEFLYPVLDTLVCYDHRFNERAGKYFGFKYKCADGTIPGESSIDFGLPIDEGVNEKYLGEPGASMPDLSGSEVQPFYLRKAGYSPVFSTNFSANMYNLNQGVILWLINTHGGPMDGGMLMFWDPEGKSNIKYPAIPGTGAKKETNPWRGYEWLLGSTEEPDTMTADIHGIIPALLGNPYRNGILRTSFDWAPAKKPILDKISNLLSKLPIVKSITPEWLKDSNDYYDGVICTVFLTRFFTGWFNGSEIESELKNLHSCGISSVACLPAGKYLHISLVRHGSVFQIMDPWATSWYSDIWQNMIPRGIAIGETIGETFTKGLSKVGILYITDPPQWWWDLWENVELFGDPDLRIWCPSTEYSDLNHWKREDVRSLGYDADLSLDGHMPFGATSYPYEKKPTFLESYLIIIVLLVILAIIIIAAVVSRRRKK